MARNINLMLETKIVEFFKVNHEGENSPGYELAVVFHHRGQQETLLAVGNEKAPLESKRKGGKWM